MATKVFLAGSITCELCNSQIGAGGRGWHGHDRQRGLRKHLQKCELATDDERAYFRSHGSWPKRRRAS